MNESRLTRLELLRKIQQQIDQGITDSDALAIAAGYSLEDGSIDKEAFNAAVAEAYKEYGDGPADEDDIINTVPEDASAFAQYASAIVRQAYRHDFGEAVEGPMTFPTYQKEAEEKLPYYYDRLSNTLFGWFAINITRAVVVGWFARQGCTDAGSPEERFYKYAEVWDEWETAHGGCDENAAPCVKVIDGSAQPGSAGYYEFLGRRIAEVLSTMCHNAQNPDDQWELTEGFNKDYEYIHKQLTEGPDIVTAAAANSVVFLPRLCERFPDIGENYVNRWWQGVMLGAMPGSLTSTNAEAPETPHGYKADDRYNLLLLITQDDYEQSIEGSEVDEANWVRVLNQADGEIYWRFIKGECLVDIETGERMTGDEYSNHYQPQGLEFFECAFSPQWSDGFDYLPLWEAAVSDGSIDGDETDVDALAEMIKADKYLMGDKGGYIVYCD